MKRFLLLLILLVAVQASVFATDVTISAQVYPGFSPAGVGVDYTTSCNVTNGSAAVTCSSGIPAAMVGIGGFTVTIAGNIYTVASVSSTTSLTLTTNWASITGAATVVFFKWVEVRIYADRAFQPLGETYVVQPGNPGSPGFFRRYAASIRNDGSTDKLYLPSIVLPATTDALISNQAKYTIGFYRPGGGLLQFYVCPLNAAPFALPPTTPTTWADICQFNSPSAIVPVGQDSYSKSIIDSRYPSCFSGQMLYVATTGRIQSCLSVGSNLSIAGGTISASTGVTDPGGNGILSRTALNTVVNRSIAVGAGLSISNADGVSGNPSISLGSDVVLKSQSVVFVQTGTVVTANSGVEVSLFGSGSGSLSLASNSLSSGKVVRLVLAGVVSTKTAPAGNVTIKFRIAGLDFTSFTTPSGLTAGMTNQPWTATFEFTVRGSGASTPIIGEGFFQYTDGTLVTYTLPITMTAVGNIDTTGSNAVDIRWQWATANSSNSISTHTARVEVLN